jgi:hypothetical protein
LTVIHSIFNGNSAYAGGEIYNVGTLTVNDSTITNNSAISFAGTPGYTASPRVGGRFYNIGMLTVNDSTITNNLATDYGGGICNESSQLVVR